MMNVRPNPYKIKIRVFEGCIRVEMTAMRIDIPLGGSERAQALAIVDALKELSGMHGAALAVALKDCSHTIITPGTEEKPAPPASNVTPIK